jgi:hypothetical protein
MVHELGWGKIWGMKHNVKADIIGVNHQIPYFTTSFHHQQP